MSDTITNDLQLTLQETGGNTNTWGGILNDNWDIVEDAIVGVASFAVTTANVTLSASQNRQAILKTSGALTGNRSVIVRDAIKEWDVYNGCTGGFDLTVKTNAGTGIIVPQGRWCRLRCDAVNVERVEYEATVIKDVAVGTNQIADGSVTGAKLAADVIAIPTGVRLGWVGTTGAVPSGWVLGDGRTIGDATSGATSRANADTSALFTLLWDAYSNTELAIQTSAGGASSRGASAAADFAAHKRLPLPDYRGRVAAGNDTMGSTSANRLTNFSGGLDGDTMGASGGSESHTLTTAQLASHSHNNTAASAATIYGGTGSSSSNSVGAKAATADGFAGFNDVTGLARFTNFVDSAQPAVVVTTTMTNATAGSGTAHNNVQPTIIEHFIIKL